MRNGFERDVRRAARKMARDAAKGAGAHRFGGWGGDFFGADGPFGGDFPFGPGGKFGGGGGRGPGRRRMFGSGELRLVLLKLLADEPRHGYDLIKAIEEMTGGAYAPSPGTVYPTLQLMLDEGVISELPDDSTRKVFSVTDSGHAELESEAEAVAELIERVSGIGEERRSSPHRQIHRAMENMRNALRYQRAGELGDEKLAKIVDLIDEVARKIERL
jgi:DNA-binding PadR family transcriptional regulator